MAVLTLESLVLRGVAVRLGALGYLRLDTSVVAGDPAPGTVNSMRQPLPGTAVDNPGPTPPNVVDPTKGICPGAGRSRRHAGFLARPGTASTSLATFGW